MSTTPTPADLDRAREWLRHGELAWPRDHDDVEPCEPYYIQGDEHEPSVASLAALLRSVREEGARQTMGLIFGPDWRDTCCPHGFTLREDCGHEDGCESDALRGRATP